MTIVRFDLSAAPRIDIDTAKQKFDRPGAVLFVDVRSRQDYDKAHIPGAVSIPLREIPQRLGMVPHDRLIVPY